MLAPPLTTIWQPAEALGETAVLMLVRHVRDKAPLVRDTWACAFGFEARLVSPSEARLKIHPRKGLRRNPAHRVTPFPAVVRSPA